MTDWEVPEQLPPGEVAGRVKRVQAAMAAAGVDVLLAQQNSDMFYLTGFVAQGVAAVPARGEPVFFVKRPFSRAARESAMAPVARFEKDQVAALRARGADIPPEPVVGLELDVLPYAWAERSRAAAGVPWDRVRDVGGLLREVRAVKTPWERRQHRQAAALVDKALMEVPNLLKEGMREVDLKARLELKQREQGAQGFVPQRRFNQEPFQGHALAGATACLASYQDSAMGGVGLSRRYPQDAGLKKIRRGEPVVVDLANAWNGYLADETRTYAIGSLPAQLRDHYQAAVDVLAFLRGRLVPGARGDALFAAAEEEFGKRGLLEHLGGLGEDRIAFIGHGIGIELDELPVLARGFANTVSEGNVVAIEPKLVFEGVGMVGVEDSHFVTEAGAEVFTKAPLDTLG
ncbi:MAG TPA: Xaa-Pro peptidase family protein [Candidatus Thermoplasmatota archaeon]